MNAGRSYKISFLLLVTGFWLSLTACGYGQCWSASPANKKIESLLDRDPGQALAQITREQVNAKSPERQAWLAAYSAQAFGELEMGEQMHHSVLRGLQLSPDEKSPAHAVLEFLYAQNRYTHDELSPLISELWRYKRLFKPNSTNDICANLQIGMLQIRLGFRAEGVLNMMDAHLRSERTGNRRLAAITAAYVLSEFPGDAKQAWVIHFYDQAALYFKTHHATMLEGDIAYYRGLSALRAGKPAEAMPLLLAARGLHSQTYLADQAAMLDNINICRATIELNRKQEMGAACRVVRQLLRKPDPPFGAALMVIMGDLERHRNHIRAAMRFLSAAISDQTLEVGNSAVIRALKMRAELWRKLGNHARADQDMQRLMSETAVSVRADRDFSIAAVDAMATLEKRDIQAADLSQKIALTANIQHEEKKAFVSMIAAITAISTLSIYILLTSNRRRRQAVIKAEAKIALVADMNHEVRGPIATMLVLVGILKRSDGMPAIFGPILQQIDGLGHRIIRQLSEMLEFAKLDANAIAIQPTSIALEKFLKEATDAHRSIAEAKGLNFRTVIEPSTAVVIADRDRLRQVLDNILSNALRFTNAGEVSLLVQPAKQGRFVRFEIHDTGRGLSKSDQKLIFERFGQAKNQDDIKFSGTGLGLAISYGLVKLMGGEMGMESTLGTGSIFWFTLPLGPPNKLTPIE